MAFDIGAGIYWRPEEGGLLWGMSNPKEAPGPATRSTGRTCGPWSAACTGSCPPRGASACSKAWAATIEYTPDHLPMLGPLVDRDGTEVEGAGIASVCGHGMMWGPAVARIAADLALAGTTGVVGRPTDFGMDRFDDDGRSPFFDPVALPFPVEAGDDES